MRSGSRSRSSRRSGFDFKRLRLKTSASRLFFAALLVVVGGWFIFTRSLPFAIAESDTETAAWLSSNHPAPLLVQARQLRAQLFSSIAKSKAAEDAPKTSAPPSNEAQSQARNSREHDTLKARISELARRILSTEPLNAEAYRMLGEVASDPKEARVSMKNAVARSRRESVAVYWLLNDSATQGDFERALGYADVLLRSRGQLTPYVVGYIAHIAESGPAGFEGVVSRLSADPPWRAAVLRYLPRSAKDLRTPLRIMKALEGRNSRVAAKYYRPYLQYLVGKKQIPLAYATWLQLQTAEQLKLVGLINNGGFQRDISNAPFGWQIGRSQNALTRFGPHSSRLEGRAFQTIFSDGRVRFSGPRQMVVLAPGSYELSGEVIGQIKAKRGLKWGVRCVASRSLGLTEEISGAYPVWTKFSLGFVVPSSGDCPGQEVRLQHAARSASEEFVSGEIWFDNIKITRKGIDQPISSTK
jgi:hypothetical protein